MNELNKKEFKARKNPISLALPFFIGILVGTPVNAAFPYPESPLQTGTRVPANLMLVLDDSGSMASEFMPDSVPGITTTNNFNMQVYTRNSLYFNPRTFYQPWQTATGVRMLDTPYSAVWNDDVALTGAANLNTVTGGVYNQISVVNGSTDRVFYYPKSGITNIADGTQYDRYLLKANGTVAVQSWVAGAWSAEVAISTGFPWSATEDVTSLRKNFANWYSYHRTRTKTAKAGVSEAFTDLPEDIRVGFNTIWNNNRFDIPVGTDDGLFRGPNKTTWYARLQGAGASGTTPLRASLTRTGDYYSSPAATGPYGPQPAATQLSCRQNFTLMTSDGFWNETGFADGTNHDGIAGPTISNWDNSSTYTYTPGPPYADTSTSTLADVAMKYWKNDLRQGANDLPNNVPTTTADPAFWQHMVTFAISIGVQGTPALFNDVAGIYAGTRPWTVPVNNTITALDDMFHASINGRGSFVVANNPDQLTQGVKAALNAIIGRVGSSSNVSANSVSVGAGTRIFQASYFSGQWTGEVAAKEIVNNAVVDPSVWNASENIPTFVSGNRKIWTLGASIGEPFPSPAQEAILTTDIANYIKGDRSKELSNTGGIYRNRVNLLGDIISSSPSYVKSSVANQGMLYVGANDGMLHAFSVVVDPDPDGNPSTNDSVTTGTEQFAYVPNILDMNRLKTLPNNPYDHKYFVDGPVVVSTQTQTPSKNILVSSLGRGGKGVFSLNVTNPATFSATDVLWEAGGSDPYMGNVISRPFITKVNDSGQMAVIVSNGINSTNDSPALFVYALETGVLLAKLTPANSAGIVVNGAGISNGLSAATGVDTDVDGDVDYVYAGDMQGHLWKFDLTSNNKNLWNISNSGKPLFSAKAADNTTALPISGGVGIGFDDTQTPWIYFGTGRYLTAGDPSTTSVQSWFGIRDSGPVVTGRSELKERKIVAVGVVNTKKVRAFENLVYNDMAGKNGWYIDFVNPPYGATEKLGERVVGTPIVRGTSVVISTIIPSSNPCTSGGTGYVNVVEAYSGTSGYLDTDGYFDANRSGYFNDDKLTDANGKAVSIGSINLDIFMPTDALVLAGGTNELIVVGGSEGGTGTVPFRGSRSSGRISWHELINN